MNAIVEMPPPPSLSAVALMNVISGLPPAQTLDVEEFSCLGRSAMLCLSEVRDLKDRYYQDAARQVPPYFRSRFYQEHSNREQAEAAYAAWERSVPMVRPPRDAFQLIISQGVNWLDLLARAAPLIAAEKERRAVETERNNAERKRLNAEAEMRQAAEQQATQVANRKAYKEAREAERPFQVVRASSLSGQAVPEIRWLIPRWLPVGYTTLLYGMPGVGKTLLAQMLATSCATGLPWLGHQVEQCKSFALFCEDDDTVIHKRQTDINAGTGTSFDELDGLGWACPVGEDNTLMRFSKSGVPEMTDYWDHLQEQVLDEGTRLLILDTASVVFGGEPNNRNEVTAFIGQLTSLAREMNGAVVLNTHPSQAAMSSGGGLGHSLAWLGSARSVWRLDGNRGQGRTLTRTKANLASTGEQVKLWMRSGFLDTSAEDTNAEEVFLALLTHTNGRDEKVSDKETSRNFAPTAFARDPGNQGFARDAFRVAMERLLSSGIVRNESYGKPSQGFTRLVTATEREKNDPGM